MVNGGDSSDSLDTESVVSRDAENRARSAHVTNKAAGLLSSQQAPSIEHRLHHYTTKQWNTSVNPGHHADKLMTQSYPPANHLPHEVANESGVTASGIPKMSEYRSQFAWPHSSDAMLFHEPTPRKSISLSAIQALQAAPPQKTLPSQPSSRPAAEAHVHKTVVRDDVSRAAKSPGTQFVERAVKSPPPAVEEPIIAKKHKQADGATTMAPLKVDELDALQKVHAIGRPKKFKTEYKSKFRAPSKYMYVEGEWKKMSRSADSADLQAEEKQTMPWYGEVIELRKKAGEYKCRSMGGNLAADSLAELYTRQEMIEQLATRSNLSALALATTPREKANEAKKEGKKSSVNKNYKGKGKRPNSVMNSESGATKMASSFPTPHLPVRRPNTGQNTWKKPKGLGREEMGTTRSQSSVRHHLERTTPTPGETGVLITSPTRDHKLEPAAVKKTEKEPKGGLGRTKSVTRASPRQGEGQAKPVTAPGTTGTANVPVVQSRSASVGTAHRSPKRVPRPMSMVVPGSKAQVNGVLNGNSDGEAWRKTDTKRPSRPTSLATSSAPARPKTTGGSARGKKGPSYSEASSESVAKTNSENRSRSAVAGIHGGAPKSGITSTSHPSAVASRPFVPKGTAAPPAPQTSSFTSASVKPLSTKEVALVNGENESAEKSETASKPARSESEEIEETIMMKSPPEPTRVKSPEQILIRSPEPVKWTIPLETGIKWTGETVALSKEEPRSPPTLLSPEHVLSPTLSSQPVGL